MKKNTLDPVGIVMSSTPSISRQSHLNDVVSYTILGGETLDRKKKSQDGFSIILLNSSSNPYRTPLFNELKKLQAVEVLSIETDPSPRDVLMLMQLYNNVRFIIFKKGTDTGHRLDTAFNEALCNHCYVISPNMQMKRPDTLNHLLGEIMERKQICTVPVIQNLDGEILHTTVGPMPTGRTRFQVLPTAPGKRETPTLFPWDYFGMYNLEKHRKLGGFDHSIKESWWQLLEYGMRAWLWGEKLSTHPELKIGLLVDLPSVNTSPGMGYRRFYLKILAVHRRNGGGRLSRLQWWSYLIRSGDKDHSASSDWKEIHHWVRENSHRYKLDAIELSEHWIWEER